MVVLLLAAFDDRGVPAEVPLVQWADVVVLVGDEPAERWGWDPADVFHALSVADDGSLS